MNDSLQTAASPHKQRGKVLWAVLLASAMALAAWARDSDAQAQGTNAVLTDPYGVQLKVVARSDATPILDAPNGSDIGSALQPLRPYFVLVERDGHYEVSSNQGVGANGIGYVAKSNVQQWNTREGLHFISRAFQQERRSPLTAWSTEEQIRQFAATLDEEKYGPTFKEELLTRIGPRQVLPYPLLDTKMVEVNGQPRKIHKVLVPAIVPPTVGVDLSKQNVQEVAGAVTFCVVFDATASMGRYAKDFAATIDEMLSNLRVDPSLAAAGFVLFRDLGAAEEQRFEIVLPMPLDEAKEWIHVRARQMIGGDDPAEPVLDAVTLAQSRFLWDAGSAVAGARRFAIVVANKDAKTETVGLASSITQGMNAGDVATLLQRSRISAYTLQAGNEDEGNLVTTLSTLAEETGGEFYLADAGAKTISEAFSRNIEALLNQKISDGAARKATVGPRTIERVDTTYIALDVVDDEFMKQLATISSELNTAAGRLIVQEAWVFDNPGLYQEKILIDKTTLSELVNFFNAMIDTPLDASSLKAAAAREIGALIGEQLADDEELQDVLERRYALHFSTSFLNYDLDHLATLSRRQQLLLQESLRDATGALVDYYEMNAERLGSQSQIWMPVSYLP